jgi:prepilin-type N-terminal cleavage/methylation domain-containing protein
MCAFNNKQGFSLIELTVAIGISAIGLYALTSYNSMILKSSKQFDEFAIVDATSKSKQMETYDRANTMGEVKLLNNPEKTTRATKVCDLVGLKYDTLDQTCKAKCVGAGPCKISIRDALCDLETRGRVPDPRFCL